MRSECKDLACHCHKVAVEAMQERDRLWLGYEDSVDALDNAVVSLDAIEARRHQREEEEDSAD